MSGQPKYTHEDLKMTLLVACNLLMSIVKPECIERLLQVGYNAGMTFSDHQLSLITLGYNDTLTSPQGEPGELREEAGREPVPATPQEGKPTDEFSAEGQGPQEPTSGNGGPLPEKNEGERHDG